MKPIFFLLCLLSVTTYSQTKIDKFVSVNIPGKVEKLDTVIKNLKVENFISEVGNENFFIQKTIFDSTSIEFNSLPSDLKSLKKTYKDCIKSFFEPMEAANIHFADSSQIKIDQYLAYRVSGKNGNIKVVESILLILNEHLYVITYFNSVDFNENNKNSFLESAKIDSTLKPSQTLGHTTEFKLGYILGKIAIYLFIGILLYFLIQKFNKK